MRSIDLNADVGEGAGNDIELLAYVSSANIACGAHAGNKESMRVAVDRSIELGVAIGAHPGHVDREHYGRRVIPILPKPAEDLIERQVERLRGVAEARGARVEYIKAHGALYHQLNGDRELADAAVAVALRQGEPLALLGVADSCLEAAAQEAGVPFFAEAFADRAYLSTGELVPRSTPGALFEDEGEVVRQALGLATDGAVTATDGARLTVRCDSICLHGDTRWAVGYAAGVRLVLARRGVLVRAFTTDGGR